MNALKMFWQKTGHLLIIAATMTILFLLGSGKLGGSLNIRWYWMMGIMAAFVMLIGTTSNKRLDGALVDWRNKMSLSHLQVILWTILGMSAFLTIGLARIPNVNKMEYSLDTAYEQSKAAGGAKCLEGLSQEEITQNVLDKCPAPEALQIVFPEELLLAMGISLASFAGSSLVKNNQSGTALLSTDEENRIQEAITTDKVVKTVASIEAGKILQEITKYEVLLEQAKKTESPDDELGIETMLAGKKQELSTQKTIGENAGARITAKEAELQKFKDDRAKAKGLLHVRNDPTEAEWGDMFKKEFSGEEKLIDLSKVQMFFFTIAIIFAYAASLNELLQRPEIVTNPFGVAIPPFSASLVVLLGISHGGYLVTKNTDAPASQPKQ